MNKESRKVGRPTKYKEEYAEQAYKLTMLGFIDAELAEFFEVDESTINNWKHDQPEFLESIKKGKSLADAEVASKLYHRAIGYSHDEDDIRAPEPCSLSCKTSPLRTICKLKFRAPTLMRAIKSPSPAFGN